ncbi:MAG: hypothetical protein R3B84_20740 [Zavarzinella sp.]
MSTNTQLVALLRRDLPAPIKLCNDSLKQSNGDLDAARDIVIRQLATNLSERTHTTYAVAEVMLSDARYDVERAFELWLRDNRPSADPVTRLSDGNELAAAIPSSQPGMSRFAHIMPRAEGYELRLIDHLDAYTEDAYGWDYDYAIQDPSTRIHRSFVATVDAALAQLVAWGCAAESLVPPSSLNSCLVNSPIEGYLELPHLTRPPNTA